MKKEKDKNKKDKNTNEEKKKLKIKKPKAIEEFKNFIMKGNVLDMAVGVIIGGAFGKIVTSLVNDILMPALSLLTGQIDLGSLKFEKELTETLSINLNYGEFLQTIFDFLIISLSIFAVIKLISKLSRKKKQEEAKEEVKVEISKEEALLTEIRDILKTKN